MCPFHLAINFLTNIYALFHISLTKTKISAHLERGLK